MIRDSNPTYDDSTVRTRMKKIRLLYFLDLFDGRGEKGQCDLVCVERLWMTRLMVVMLTSYSHVVSVILVLTRVGPILRRRYELE